MAAAPTTSPMITPIARWQHSLPLSSAVCSVASADGTFVVVGFADGKIWLLTRDDIDAETARNGEEEISGVGRDSGKDVDGVLEAGNRPVSAGGNLFKPRHLLLGHSSRITTLTVVKADFEKHSVTGKGPDWAIIAGTESGAISLHSYPSPSCLCLNSFAYPGSVTCIRLSPVSSHLLVAGRTPHVAILDSWSFEVLALVSVGLHWTSGFEFAPGIEIGDVQSTAAPLDGRRPTPPPVRPSAPVTPPVLLIAAHYDGTVRTHIFSPSLLNVVTPSISHSGNSPQHLTPETPPSAPPGQSTMGSDDALEFQNHLATLPPPSQVTLDPTGKRVAVVGKAGIVIYDVSPSGSTFLAKVPKVDARREWWKGCSWISDHTIVCWTNMGQTRRYHLHISSSSRPTSARLDLYSTVRLSTPSLSSTDMPTPPGSPTSSGTTGYIPDPTICVVQGAKKSVLVLSVWSNSTAAWIGNVSLDVGEAEGAASVDRGQTFLVGKANWHRTDRMATVVGVVGERVAIGHSDGSILLGPLSLIYTHSAPVGLPPTPESVSNQHAHSNSTSILELHLHAAPVLCIASYATPTREVLVSGSSDSSLKFWDCKDGACLARKDDHSGGCIGAHVIPKGSKWEGCVAAWWGDGGVSLIEGEGFRTLLSISHPRQRPTSLSYLPSQNLLLVTCLDGSVYVWRDRTGALDRIESHDWALEAGEAKQLVDFTLGALKSLGKSIFGATGGNHGTDGRPLPVLALSVNIRRLVNEHLYNRSSKTPPESPTPIRASRTAGLTPSYVASHRRSRTSEEDPERTQLGTPGTATLSVLTESVRKTSGKGLAALQELTSDVKEAFAQVSHPKTAVGPPARINTPAKAHGIENSPTATIRVSVSSDDGTIGPVTVGGGTNRGPNRLATPDLAPQASHGPKRTLRPQSGAASVREEDSAQGAPPAVPTGEDLTRAVLASLHPWKLDAHIDSLVEKYGISKPTYDIGIGLRGAGEHISIPFPSEVSHSESDWSIGSKYTASRLMSLVAMIWAVLSKKKKGSKTDEDVLQLVTFFCSDGLANSVGQSFCNPSLSHVSNFWQDSVPEVQQAARSVFRGLISRLPRKEKEIMYKEWALRVDAGTSIAQDGSRALSDIALRNTLLLGIIGSDEGDEELDIQIAFSVANNLIAMLSDHTKVLHRVAAVEILARGLNTWEPHISSVNLLRTFSYLGNFLPNPPGGAASVALLSVAGVQKVLRDSMTEGPKRMSPSPSSTLGRVDSNLPPALVEKARQATLHVATTKTELFVSTITMDLGHAPSMGERIGTLKSLTFVVMKRPVVLMPFLAKIVEVIVKLLDPNIPNMRDSLLSSVTPALQDIVKTYPAITFQSSTQRLAVGDTNGEVVVFDLKTGAPWQILEGTSKAITVVSFSPDGKTICAYSAEDATIRFWQPTTNLLGMMFGGRSVSAVNPIRSYHVIFGKADDPQPPVPTPSQALESVRLNWLSEKSVKLTSHKGLTLNFSL